MFRGLGGAGKKLRKLWVDGTYRRSVRWVAEQCWFRLEPVLRRDSSAASSCCRGGGWSSGPSRG